MAGRQRWSSMLNVSTQPQWSSARGRDKNLPKRRKSIADERAWVQTQMKTFTNWVNDRLRDTGCQVEDLQEDLDDGLTLLKLIECLVPEKKFPK